MTTSEQPAMTSQHITESPLEKAPPLSPTSCSVERLVRSSEPAMTTPVRLRPARKNPSSVSVPFPRVSHQVRNATRLVKKMKVRIVVIVRLVYQGEIALSGQFLSAHPVRTRRAQA